MAGFADDVVLISKESMAFKALYKVPGSGHIGEGGGRVGAQGLGRLSAKMWLVVHTSFAHRWVGAYGLQGYA